MSDTARGSGLPGFFFLPPIAGKVRFTGSFVGGLSPEVTVEEVGGRGTIATFTRGGDEDHRVLEEDDRYEAKWHVEHSGVKDGSVYRIHVSVNGVELGFAEAKGAHGDARKDARRQGYVPVDGGELVIAFRIEKEALGSVTRTIGVEGGRVCTANGACIVVPPGALDAPAVLTIEQTTLVAPAGLGAITPVYRLSPEGKVFAKPVQLILPVPTGTTAASVYWTAMGSQTQFDSVGGRLGGGVIATENVHFSQVFAGAPSPTRTVTGNRVVTYISASTRADVPTAAAVAVEALVHEGGNVYRSIPGTFLVDANGVPTGVFTIPGVPSGFYVLHVGNQLIHTDSNAPDLGYAMPGHLDPPLHPTAGPSLLDISLTMGDPWQASDLFELIGPENDMWDFETQWRASPAAGATTARFTIDLQDFNGVSYGLRHLFEQPLAPCPPGTPAGIWCGDRLLIAHQSTRTSANGVPYQQISEFGQFAPFSTVTGGTQVLDTVMGPLPVTRSADVDYRGADFRAAVLADGNPAVNLDPSLWVGGFFDIVGQPGMASDGFYSANADMALFQDPFGTSVRTGTFTYGSAESFGGNWGEFAVARWNGRVSLALPGALPMPEWRSLASGFQWSDTVGNMTVPAIVEPKVTMPTGITVSGTSGTYGFFDGGTGIGQSPVVSWAPPRVGIPDVYGLTVYLLSVQPNGLTRFDPVWTIYTPGTQVHFRAGALAPGRTYAFSLAAIKKANPTAPFRTGLGDFSAYTPSGMFTP